MHLLPEPLFSVPTDGSYILTIKGTNDGRIFMGAKDGCLYELVYQVIMLKVFDFGKRLNCILYCIWIEFHYHYHYQYILLMYALASTFGL